METMFIKSGNQIFNRNHVCGVQYGTFNSPELVRYKSKLIVFTVDGKEIVFYDEAADILWEVLFDASLDLTPAKPAVEQG